MTDPYAVRKAAMKEADIVRAEMKEAFELFENTGAAEHMEELFTAAADYKEAIAVYVAAAKQCDKEKQIEQEGAEQAGAA